MNILQRYGCLAAAAAVITLGMVSAPGHAQEIVPRPQPAPHQDLITVTGTASVKATPDTASIRFGVDTQRPTAQKATSDEAKAMQDVVAAVRQAGIADADIRTEQFNLEPQYEPLPGNAGGQRLSGFRATNMVEVIVHDAGGNLSASGPVIDAALAAGANRVDGINFYVQDDSKLRSQALAKAAAVAAEKAHVLAAALDIGLDGMASVTEGISGGESPMPMMRMAMAGAASTPILPGQVTISASVTLQYHIKPQ